MLLRFVTFLRRMTCRRHAHAAQIVVVHVTPHRTVIEAVARRCPARPVAIQFSAVLADSTAVVGRRRNGFDRPAAHCKEQKTSCK